MTALAAMVGLRERFDAQRQAFNTDPYPDWRARVDRLTRLESILREDEAEICAAISADFGGRSADETRLLELFPSLEGIKHTRRHTRAWMQDDKRHTSIWFLPGRSLVRYQPLGVIGIVVPWNYPLFLAIGPLTGSLAAGNRAMVKMSELAPRLSALLAEQVARKFAPEELSIVSGDGDVARAFCALPFDHLLFTGSTAVGHHIMRAAADNLTPVTLELGGKSPALVAPDFPLERAASRIMVGKLMNAGQTCIAPDYALVSAKHIDAFVELAHRKAAALYPRWREGGDYTTIISNRHYDRLESSVEAARASGARVVSLGPIDDALRTARIFPPTLVIGGAPDAVLMREEIFGPVLPIVPYESTEEAIAYVNARPRPLALYVFDGDRRRIDQVLRTTISGGVTVNDVILHIAQDDLPFGGVGASGMGHYHGIAGFNTFSKEKPVFLQSRVNVMHWFSPPYGTRFRSLVRLLLR